MKTKVKSIEVSLNNDYIMWEVNLADIVKDTKLTVSEGCSALYIVNGMLESNNTPGQWLINTKDEAGSALKLIGVNSNKTYEILCGAGGVPFKDWELNIETLVGTHGTCRFSITQPWAVYTALGKANVTVEDIDDYMKPKLIEEISNALAVLLQKYDFHTVNTQTAKLSADLEDKLIDKFAPLGIEIKSIAIEQIFFNEQYQQARADKIKYENDMKQSKEMKKERERSLRAQAEIYKAMKEASVDGDVEDVIDFVNGKYCTKCGAKNRQSATFCFNCGEKLD